MKYLKLIVIVSLAILLTNCGSGSTTTNTTVVQCDLPAFNAQIGQSLINSWGAGLQTYNAANNPDIYTSAGYFTMLFYTPDASLLPTVSPIQRDGTQDIYNYFTEFLAKNPVMSLPNPESTDFVPLGCGYGAAHGYYDFVVYPGTPQESSVSARFTFIYAYESHPFNESVIVESGPSAGNTLSQTNNPGWYIYLQQSALLPPAPTNE